MRNLVQTIKENVELKYEHLRGLSSLKPKDIKKVTGVDVNKGASSVSRALKNPLCSVPLKGKVKNFLKASDHLMFDIDSDDIWIKFKLLFEAQNNFVEAEFDVKVDKSSTGEQFQKIV
jgi:hypothetical protein